MATKSSKSAKVNTKTKKAVVETKTPVKEKDYSFFKSNTFRVSAILVLIIALVVIRRDLYMAATVNGEAVTRFDVVRELEKQNGKATLENLITKKLILQEAENRNLEIKDEEINEEIKEIEKNLSTQGMTLQGALDAQGMTRRQLDDEIRIQLTLERLTEDKVKVTKVEIEKFITDNKSQFSETSTAEEQMKTAEEQLISQKAQTARQALIEELQARAKIKNFVNY